MPKKNALPTDQNEEMDEMPTKLDGIDKRTRVYCLRPVELNEKSGKNPKINMQNTV